MNRYTRKPETVEAFEYRYPASQELKDWLGDAFDWDAISKDSNKPLLALFLGSEGKGEETISTATFALEGDYIIKRPDGKFEVMSKESFEAKYEPCAIIAVD